MASKGPSSSSSDHSAVPSANSQGLGSPQKTWTAGTLTYTSGALVVLFIWLLWGDFSWAIRDRSVTEVFKLMLRDFGASDFIAGLLVLSLPNAIGVIAGPILSYRSDRFRSRWGRRIPFLLVTTPIAVLAMVGLAFSPQIGTLVHDQTGMLTANGQVLLMMGIFWLIFEFAIVAPSPIFHGLVNDVVPQELIGRFYGLFRAVSLIAGMLFNWYVFGYADQHYTLVLLGVAAVYGIGLMAMCLKVKEGSYPPPPVQEPGKAGNFFEAAKTYFRECFTKPYYLWVFAAQTLCWVAMMPPNLYNLYFAQSLGISADQYGKFLTVQFGVSLVLSYFLGWLCDRLHPLRVTIASMALIAIGMFVASFLIKDSMTFAFAMVGTGILAGVMFTATASLGQRLYPKVQFAQFYSGFNLIHAGIAILVAPLVGIYLDNTGNHYNHTYFMSGALSVGAIICLLVVHKHWLHYGGNRDYKAPL